MPSINQLTIMGHAGRNPEMRYSPNGNPVTSFSIATSHRYKSGEEWKEQTEWVDVIAWNKLAEICQERVSKGDLVYVQGRLQSRSWEGQDGKLHFKNEIVASTIKFFTKREQSTEPDQVAVPEELPF